MRWVITPLACAVLVLGASGVTAQQRPMYRCNVKGTITYQHVPCEGGTIVNEKKRQRTPRDLQPPQDRAKAANRARLTPEERKECEALDVTIPQLEDGVKARGPDVKPEDERELTEARRKYRELRC